MMQETVGAWTLPEIGQLAVINSGINEPAVKMIVRLGSAKSSNQKRAISSDLAEAKPNEEVHITHPNHFARPSIPRVVQLS